MLMLALLFLLITEFSSVISVASKDFVTCKREYQKIGCFEQSESVAEVMLINDRDETSDYYQGHLINWHQFDKSLHSLACRCYEEAKKKGFTYFAIRYWGECYGGRNEVGLDQLLKSERGRSNNCANINYKQCENHLDGTECVGRQNAEYVYRASLKMEGSNTDGGYSEWSNYTRCSSTCGDGVSSRERTCTHPEPKGTGKDCSELGPMTETKSCKLKDCPIDGAFTNWSSFDECSTTCGNGVKSRSRSCTNPKPQHGGKECAGLTTQTQPCKKAKCSVARCPSTHPYAYYQGKWCCVHNKEKVYTPQGAKCDGSRINIDSLCCQGNKHAKCVKPPCKNHESNAEVARCPSTHPYAYYLGKWCCVHNKEKVYTPQGAKCDGSRININSLCCQGNKHTKCVKPPCKNHESNAGSDESVARCPSTHPYAYYQGKWCCVHNKEKVYTPQGAKCDGSRININSLCCQGNKHAKCVKPPCKNHESNAGSDESVARCPSTHPYAYYQGKWCCVHNKEKVYTPQGAKCDGSRININSLCCQGNKHTKCVKPPCKNHESNTE